MNRWIDTFLEAIYAEHPGLRPGTAVDAAQELEELPEGNEENFRMSMAGTLRYMAVEIVNTGSYGLKADVYSWAVVAFEMLTLEVPFAGLCGSPATHRRFVCREGERPDFPEGSVPASLQKLIQDSWAQETCDRPCMASVCSRLKSLVDANFETETTGARIVRSVKSYPAALPDAFMPFTRRGSFTPSPKRPSLVSSILVNQTV